MSAASRPAPAAGGGDPECVVAGGLVVHARPLRARALRTHSPSLTFLVVSAVAIAALGARPPEAVEVERKAQALALEYLIRKTDALSTSLVDRRNHLRRRLRAMYKMSRGGYLRLILGAETPSALYARRDAAKRILGPRSRRAPGGARRAQRAHRPPRGAARGTAPRRDPRRRGPRERPRRPRGKGGLSWPVAGAIVQPFGVYRDAAGLEYSHDGAALATSPEDPVIAPADGTVRFVGEVPGLGASIIIDHGDGWATLLGGITDVRPRVGERVTGGLCIARAAGERVELQVNQGRAWLDPSLWLAPRGQPRVAAARKGQVLPAVRAAETRATLERTHGPMRK